MVSYTGLTQKREGDPRFCGPRCASVSVFQKLDSRNVEKTSFWNCKSHVSNIVRVNGEELAAIDREDVRISSNDDFAHKAAGAVSWTGYKTSEHWADRQSSLYPQGTFLAPDRDLVTAEVENILMRFSAGAIAAFDDHGIHHTNHLNSKDCNPQSQQLKVNWRYVPVILGVVCLLPLVSLLYISMRANRSIVRDEFLQLGYSFAAYPREAWG